MNVDAVTPGLGARVERGGVRFAVRSGSAARIDLCLFDESGEHETARIPMARTDRDVFTASVSGAKPGQRYGFRADGEYAPERGLWFDPDKLLMDPYAIEVDRPYRYDALLAAPRGRGGDSAPLMPKAVVVKLPRAVAQAAPVFRPGGLVYEVPVRAFTRLHPKIAEVRRGTVAALADKPVLDHLARLGVGAVELMPVTASIDERHLPPLGLTNAWGYNPVSFMALDPRAAPGGIAELRATVAALRKRGIGVILDLVFNHTGESDVHGPTLSLRGLDAPTYFRREADGSLTNVTGTGNTLACDNPAVIELVLDTLRHFVLNAGVDGFRFDLAPVLGRTDEGFDPKALLLAAMLADPVLADRVLIAEPWDIGHGGYQLGNFPGPFLEWNDRYRDDLRRFWRGDLGMVGALATRLAGSFDTFVEGPTRTVNFLAAHDGFTLADVVRYERKHNEANGEENRDGHDENLSWNCGVEGPSDDPAVAARRVADLKAMLTTLFLSRGTIMLTAGDEFGRTQHGNNNAYAQDNEAFWHDWEGRDRELEAHVAALSELRRSHPALSALERLTGEGTPPDVAWLTEAGRPMSEADWHDPHRHRLVMVLSGPGGERIALLVNGDRRQCVFTLPSRPGFRWGPALGETYVPDGTSPMPGRSCLIFVESKNDG